MQLRTQGHDAGQQAEEDVGVEVALVGLVEDDGGIFAQRKVGLDLLQRRK